MSERSIVRKRAEGTALRLHSLALISILLLFAGSAVASAAQSSGGTMISVTNPLDAAALVYVSGYEISPEVFYPGETGTVTVYVTNAANTSVSVSQPNLIDSHLKVINIGDFATATSIGPGETIEFNFVVTATGSDGTYLPLFTVSTNVYGASAIHSQIKLRIDSSDVRASISLKPDRFSLDTKDRVNVSVVNSRSGNITNVLIVPETVGATVSPDESFAGNLGAGQSVQVPFFITPKKDTTVTFHVSFKNGDNRHTTDVVLPVVLGDNKQGAEIVINNIESTSTGSTFTLKGDVTNNGLTAARSVLVTVGSPATPVDPNPEYAIGNLEPDDFSSFEVTYSKTGPGAVPLIVRFKDSDGNMFSRQFTMDGSSNSTAYGQGGMPGSVPGSSGSSFNRRSGMFGSFGSGLNQVPLIPIAVILIAVIALIIAWRKGLLKGFAGRFRKKQDDDDEELKEQ
ncbi:MULTISPECIES: hypothetical protein [unclassified Methanoregula]|uniref:hypothetical protein n=1 Tax=unclassified Methanoregula TaxID=2649730 RepID=UPI0025CDBF8A|nr:MULTISPECIES: hypothetical protein [unclassified Methanoregula]